MSTADLSGASHRSITGLTPPTLICKISLKGSMNDAHGPAGESVWADEATVVDGKQPFLGQRPISTRHVEALAVA